MPVYGKMYKKKAGRRGRPKGSKNKVLSKAAQKQINYQILGNQETKIAIYNSNVTAFNQQANSSGDCLRLIPQVSSGTGQGQRISNKLKMTSLHIRGVLTFTLGQTSNANIRIGVRMIILRAKRFIDWQQTQSDFASSYTRLLEGSVNGLNGDLSNYNSPCNRDYFTIVKDKRYTMSLSLGTSPQQVAQSVKSFRFKVPYSKKTLTYDENYSSTDPVDYPYVMILSYTKLDGSLPDTAATTYLTCQYTTALRYKDA